MISADSCDQVVAGNYDVIVNELPPSQRSVLIDFLEHKARHEAELDPHRPYEGGYANEFKLLKEFSKTLKEDKANLEAGEQEYNLRKNRYKDIIPFSHTRVILSSDPQIPGSEYINANYIKGPSGSPRAYIACQGPLQCTLIDFWRMIWECGVSVIIMACNEEESGKPKCELYWPEQLNATQRYGNVQVTLVKVRQICSDFLIRKFSVKLIRPKKPIQNHKNQEDIEANGSSKDYHLHHHHHHNNKNQVDHLSHSQQAAANIITNSHHYNHHQQQINNNNNNNGDAAISYDHSSKQQQLKLDGTVACDDLSYGSCNDAQEGDDCQEIEVISERTICQFHYTTWPDHGAPDSVHPILELVRLVRDVQPGEDKPILVHCSAGCGRTGTICCIDFVWGLLRRGKLDTSFDLCNIISEMRQQRMAMVQTLEQYILCHRAVAALFINQLSLLDGHTYDHVENGDDQVSEKSFDEQDLGPVFI